MWTEFNGHSHEWDEIIVRFSNSHPTKLFNWTRALSDRELVHRLLFVPGPGQAPTAAIQLLRKKALFGINYFRSDGGLAGDFGTLPELFNWLNSQIGSRFWYLRFFDRGVRNAGDIILLQGAGCGPTLTRIHTGLSVFAPLSIPYAGKYSGNWRHNLSRALKKGLLVSQSHTSNKEEVLAVCQELERTKNIGTQFTEDELRHLLTQFGNNLLTVEVRSKEGALLSFRAALRVGKKAFDLVAATSEVGRTQYASNLAFHTLLEFSAKEGVEWYDCAGIDPENGKGVMSFKLGAGAQPFEYAGEWDYSPHSIIRITMNILMKLKLKFLAWRTHQSESTKPKLRQFDGGSAKVLVPQLDK